MSDVRDSEEAIELVMLMSDGGGLKRDGSDGGRDDTGRGGKAVYLTDEGVE